MFVARLTAELYLYFEDSEFLVNCAAVQFVRKSPLPARLLRTFALVL